jgi:hypothetical protein
MPTTTFNYNSGSGVFYYPANDVDITADQGTLTNPLTSFVIYAATIAIQPGVTIYAQGGGFGGGGGGGGAGGQADPRGARGAAGSGGTTTDGGTSGSNGTQGSVGGNGGTGGSNGNTDAYGGASGTSGSSGGNGSYGKVSTNDLIVYRGSGGGGGGGGYAGSGGSTNRFGGGGGAGGSGLYGGGKVALYAATTINNQGVIDLRTSLTTTTSSDNGSGAYAGNGGRGATANVNTSRNTIEYLGGSGGNGWTGGGVGESGGMGGEGSWGGLSLSAATSITNTGSISAYVVKVDAPSFIQGNITSTVLLNLNTNVILEYDYLNINYNEVDASFSLKFRNSTSDPIDDNRINDKEVVTWMLCTVDTNSLIPIENDPLSAIDYWFSHLYYDKVLVDNITSYPSKTFTMQLTPYVGSTDMNLYMPIMPYISGGTSLQVYTTSQRFSAERTLIISNSFEKDSSWLQGGGANNLSGVLSGVWWNNSIGVSALEIAPISGLIDYINGNLWVDMHNVPNSYFQTGLSSIYIRYEGNYPTQLNTETYYCSSQALNIKTYGDTTSYAVCCYTPYLALEGISEVFHPSRIAIQENDYNFTTASISAVYQSRDTLFSLNSSNFSSASSWPSDDDNGRAIVWKSNSSIVSAYQPNNGNILTTFPISGWSSKIDTLNLIASGTDNNFYISACFPDDTLSNRTTAVYEFNYAIPLSEGLFVNTESYTLTSEILKVYRRVTTNNGVYNRDPLSSLRWNFIDNSFPYFYMVASSGVAINDYTIDDYLTPQYLPLTGNVGLVSSVPLCSINGVLTGYDYVYGLDYLKTEYYYDPDVIYTYSVAYNDNPSISAIHSFQIYTAPSAIMVSAIAFENQPFTRLLTAKAFNNREGSYIPLHPMNKIKWAVNVPDAVIATSLDGDTYTFGEYANDTMVFHISTSTFDLNTVFPVICAITVEASAYDTYNAPYNTFKATSGLTISIDTFPSANLFYSKLQLNQEFSDLITDMWRVSASPYMLTAIDITTIAGTNVVTGDRLIDFGDGRTTTVSPTTVEFDTVVGIYDITLLRSNVSAAGWLSAHSIESNMNLHLVTRYISADFMVYPTYVFVNSGTQVINSLTDPITTFGASAYDVGHTEPFILVALDNTLPSYNWKVGNTTLAGNTSSIIYNVNTITDDLSVSLDVYNTELAYPMPETYMDDNTGLVSRYPNRKTTDNLTLTTQHISMMDYEHPEIVVTIHTNNVLLTLDVPTTVSATVEVVYPINTPVIETGSTLRWILSTPNWTKTLYTPTLDYDITMILNNSDPAAGTIGYKANYPLVLTVERDSELQIPNTFAPSDWGKTTSTASSSLNITLVTTPVLDFYPTQNYVLVNEPVTFINSTLQTSALCAFYIYDGYSTTAHYIAPTAYADFITSYSVEGTYNLYVTGVLINNQTYSSIFSSIINVISSFGGFDENVSRTFGVTELTFPYTYSDTTIPANEWATANNFNRSMNRLNSNFEYLKNMAKFYSLPPTDFIGWLGTKSVYGENVFKWNIDTAADYQTVDNVVSNDQLINVSDVVFKNNRLYVADANSIKIYDNIIMSNNLNTITLKTFDDPLITVKSIAVDSLNRIYALDAPKNRVVVFNQYIDGDPNSNKFLFEWGVYGGPKAKTGFNTPNDITIDRNDDIWIIDAGNKAIKKYTRTGSWLQTTDISDYADPISLAIDSENNIHVLTTENVLKLTNTGTFITTYNVYNPQNALPKKIANANGSGFLYVCFDKYIVKVLESGIYAGIFATDISTTFSSVYQDTNYNLYVANMNNVLKYFDIASINQLRDTLGDKYLWTLDDITVDKDENIQDWVCNMAFKRMWDNIELLRRSLTGKISYTTTSKGLPFIEIINFTKEEYENLFLSSKDEIFVGINEFVTADVLNRCIKQLYDNLEILRAGM